ncbi:S49 family peptidase [Granulicoccus sp. GXG6511]|uniref:S49 family peptidase n=1 Tax=Granulicoccus sp. GXG6511 TaxID=3381351 RepID=UPI003D7E540A
MPAGHTVAVPVREPGPFRRGFGLGAGAGAGLGVALAVIGTVLSLLSALGVMAVGAAAAAAGGGAAPANTSTVWGSPTATHTLRAVDVTGSILTDGSGGGLLAAGTYGYEVARMIDDIDAEDADGLVLRLNTPGGTITGSKAIADAVARYQQRTGKKVFAHVQGMSASGGVYAMAGADDIRADHGSTTGSIGVIMAQFARYRDVVAVDGGLLQGGVTTTGGIEEIYITEGRSKDLGNPYRDATPEELAHLQQLASNEYDRFVEHVATLRDIPAATIRDELGANLFDNKLAEEHGLIDGTMGADEAYRHFATEAGVDPADTKIVAPAAPTMLQALLGAENRVPGQALPVEVQSGVRPVTSAAMCGRGPAALAYHGDLGRICG